jgi:alginate O-acetyltransferase complex protein AlgI
MGVTRNPYLATLATFTTIGLWHEISPRYIVWGLYHGIGILVWRRFQAVKGKYRPGWCSLPVPAAALSMISILFTVHFVFFSLVIVNQPNFSSVLDVYSKTLLFWW